MSIWADKGSGGVESRQQMLTARPISFSSVHFSSVQSLSRVWLFVTPWIAAHQASLSITTSRSLPKHMSIESVMPSSHIIFCCPLLLLPPIPPSIRVFSNDSTLRMRSPEYWSFCFSISPSNEHPGLISFRMDRLELLPISLDHIKSSYAHENAGSRVTNLPAEGEGKTHRIHRIYSFSPIKTKLLFAFVNS